MIDATGHRVASIISRETRADLPLLAGPGADRAVGEARAVLAEAGPIRGRVRGLIRVGERRWDLMLDREQVLMLPESDPVSAVARVVALDAQEQLLARDIRSIDLRNPDRVTIRLGASALDGTGEIELAGD